MQRTELLCTSVDHGQDFWERTKHCSPDVQAQRPRSELVTIAGDTRKRQAHFLPFTSWGCWTQVP